MSKLIIFDLDGVLVDACEWHRLSLNQALKEISGYEISLKDHYSTFNGIPTRVKLSMLVEMGVIKEKDQNSIYNRKQELSIEIIDSTAKIDSDKIEMINALKNAGHNVACFTNSIRQTAELMLKKTGVFDLLDFVLTNQDVECPKPNPEGYNYLVEKFEFQKSDVYIIEDSPKGLQAAYASGCNVIEVKDPKEVNIKLLKELL